MLSKLHPCVKYPSDPVAERTWERNARARTDRGTLGKLEVKLVNPLQYPLSLLQSLTTLDRQLSQPVPLVADTLQEKSKNVTWGLGTSIKHTPTYSTLPEKSKNVTRGLGPSIKHTSTNSTVKEKQKHQASCNQSIEHKYANSVQFKMVAMCLGKPILHSSIVSQKVP